VLEPLLADDAFLADLEGAGGSHDRVRLWWLGQSGCLVEHRGRRLLIDPYLSDSLTRKYAGTDKPHVRLTRRVVDPARLTGIDVVTSTHNHTDHLDGETLRAVLTMNPGASIVVPAANTAFAAERLGVPPARLTAAHEGLPLHVKGFDLLGLPSAHETLERDDEGRPRFLGYPIRA
jgi:L-ascorbate metabolism protein UlaG (beta-lactamase superfamily)